MSQIVHGGFFSDLPVELMSVFFKYIDDIKTITRLLATCRYIHDLKIVYKIYLIRTKNAFGNWIWTRNPTSILAQNSTGRLYLETTTLEQYCKAVKHQHALRNIFFPTITILGFNSDLSCDILNSFKLTCDNFYHNPHDIFLSKIIDHGTHRHAIFKNKNRFNYIQFKCGDCNYQLNILFNSEILTGRHHIYNKINAKISHTATNYIVYDDKNYYISFYTEPMIIF